MQEEAIGEGAAAVDGDAHEWVILHEGGGVSRVGVFVVVSPFERRWGVGDRVRSRNLISAGGTLCVR
jgi:hypothetical protein